MKYLVMECHLSYAVVLDEEGRFLRAANRNYQVGQTVTDIVEMALPPARKPIPWARTLTTLAACLMVVLGLFLFRSPYASVYLTINPQVRVDVNRNDQVLRIEGINPDGAALLHDYHYKGKPLDTVMDELVDRAIDLDYLHDGDTLELALDADERWVADHQSHLREELTRHLGDRITITIDIHSRTAESTPSTPPETTPTTPPETTPPTPPETTPPTPPETTPPSTTVPKTPSGGDVPPHHGELEDDDIDDWDDDDDDIHDWDDDDDDDDRDDDDDDDDRDDDDDIHDRDDDDDDDDRDDDDDDDDRDDDD